MHNDMATVLSIIAQGIGFLAAATYFIGFQQKNRSKILLCSIIANMFFIVHFIMLGAYTGAALNAVNAVRSVIYSFNEKKWASSRLWLVFFCFVSVVCSVLTWDDVFSLFPLVAMLVTSISFWLKSERLIRVITLPTSPCWFIYNMHSGSISGMVTEVIVSLSLIIAIIRYDVLGKTKKTGGNINADK